ncbi:MAG: aminotransferase class V-fold PLP-dependent enzyme [Cyclobacteriaceae bacterium]|nr:aminotransferase class V-fold PLP-dependent enzyme [Cyclobacteriaceae bacterium]
MLESQKHLFSLEEGVHYLNCAYMSPLMKSVQEAGIQGMKGKSQPYNVSPEDFFTETNELRNEYARLIDCTDPFRIVTIPSVSYGMATVAKNMKGGKGKNIVVLAEQFPSNVYPWLKIGESKNMEVRSVKARDNTNERGKQWNEDVLAAIDNNTVLVALPHVHWSDGTLFDLKTIRKATKEVGALLVIDGTQSVGALPFSIKEFQPDALICAGYKWLFGPYSIGLAYFGEAFDNGEPLEENWINRLNSEDFSGLVKYSPEYQKGSLRYEVGEHSNFILIPMMLQAIRQLNSWKIQEIQEYAKHLGNPWLEKLKEKGFEIEDSKYRGSHLIGIRKLNLNVNKLQQNLKDHKIFASVRGNSVRLAINVFNEDEDLNEFVKVMGISIS